MSRFCTAQDEGQPCSRRALPGQSFCYGHHPKPFAPRRCEYFNLRGERCGSLTLRGQDHCFTHSPRNHRLARPAVPLIPRTRTARTRTRRSKTGLAALSFQQHADVPNGPPRTPAP